MSYVTSKMLQEMQNVRGKVLNSTERISLVETVMPYGTIYTVWNPEENFHFTNTFDKEEAEKVFAKYSTYTYIK